MKAIIHGKKEGLEGLTLGEMEVPKPRAGEVRVKLKVAGLNHRDLFIPNRHNPSEGDLVLGADGSGIIDAIGENVSTIQVGDEVIINPSLGWEKKSPAPPEGFEILGHPYHGTFAEYVTVPAENVVKKPEHLTWEEAGVLALASITAYRALFTRGNIQPGMKVLIPGIGSGVAIMLLLYAKAVGATVYVTSRSELKREEALKLGADKAFDSNADWEQELNGEKVDLVIECVGAATFNKSLAQLKKGGTIVTFGASTGDVVQFDLRNFFYGQYTLLGLTMGSSEEFQEAIEFISKHKIKPVIDKIYTLEQYSQAFERIRNAEQFGKIGFTIS